VNEPIPDWLVRAGMTEEAARQKAGLFERIERALDSAGGTSMQWFVPGRIEVLGKHTDYAGGRSLLCTVERGFSVGARPRADALVHLIDVARGVSGQVALSPDLDVSGSDWTVFPAAVARRLSRDFPGGLRGADVAFASDLPAAAGMSSSSALLTSIVAVLSGVNRLPERDEYARNIRTIEDFAGYLGCIENGQPFRGLAGGGGVGTFGGSEDHTAILASEAGRLKQYAFCPVRLERTLPAPSGCRFAIAASGVAADKTGAAREQYNRASLAVRSILEAWRAIGGSDAPTLAAALSTSPDAAGRLRAALWSAGAAADGTWLSNRFEQFWMESEVIVPQAADALARGDFATFGTLVDRSQAAAEVLLRNQVPETTWLAQKARALGAMAASAFGAGFGGSVWALVAEDDASAFAARWRDAYASVPHRQERAAEFFVTAAGPPLMKR
jgi:galactokinase